MPVKLVFVLPDLGRGGAQRVMLTLARSVNRAQFDPSILIIGRADDFAPELPDGIPVERLNAARLRGSLFRLAMALRRIRPEIVVSTLGYVNLGLLGLRPLIGRNVKVIVREANVVETTLSSMPRWFPARRLYQRLYPRAAMIFAQTQDIRNQLASIAPSAAARIEILPNPVDEDELRRRASRPTRVSGDGLRLVAAGRLTHQKGFDRLVELMPALPPDAYLTIFGEGPQRAELETRIEQLGIHDRVSLAGFTRDIASAIAGADLFVLPSRWEGLPNVVLEALALGTPVVASEDSRIEDIAAAAVPGALTIAPVNGAFVAAIAAHKPAAVPSLRPSLLPVRYRQDAVAAEFNALLERVAGVNSDTKPDPCWVKS
jgi:glycosyltransferase involved in cell wall biosynthesis